MNNEEKLIDALGVFIDAAGQEFLYQTGQTVRPERNYPPQGTVCGELSDAVNNARLVMKSLGNNWQDAPTESGPHWMATRLKNTFSNGIPVNWWIRPVDIEMPIYPHLKVIWFESFHQRKDGIPLDGGGHKFLKIDQPADPELKE